ncbi:MAG: hypothetical protein CL678_15425 [Bdellovibrionaceae bacterium]|nr:hypothetical protein [Pseudobdellovibrionaceae bacterium]|tara:strand:+ start:618 stop:1187 length:570 start_codon:yes stop_codon:yes gene_type:complete
MNKIIYTAFIAVITLLSGLLYYTDQKNAQLIEVNTGLKADLKAAQTQLNNLNTIDAINNNIGSETDSEITEIELNASELAEDADARYADIVERYNDKCVTGFKLNVSPPRPTSVLDPVEPTQPVTVTITPASEVVDDLRQELRQTTATVINETKKQMEIADLVQDTNWKAYCAATPDAAECQPEEVPEK